jgi:hypothetical protein
MSRFRLVGLGLVVVLLASLERPMLGQGVVGAFIAGAEAGSRERLRDAEIEILKLQRELLAETVRQQQRQAAQPPPPMIAAPQPAASERQFCDVARTALIAEPSSQFWRDEVKRLCGGAAEAMTAEVLRLFTQRHPDWPAHEKTMVAYGVKLPPGQLDESSYLDVLYFLATRDAVATAVLPATP